MAEGEKTLVLNRKARHDYFIEETFEAGIELKGSEVKSCRMGKANFKDGYINIKDNEAFLVSSHISPYEKGSMYNPDPDRERRLLLHKKQITYLNEASQKDGMTLIPLRLYLKKGRVKLELGIARGKKLYDKRDSKKEADAKRQMDRAMSRNQKY
ncbi:MAG: SsrA-binding protein SmpB [Clostridia bacterium]|nr:SsrA-binding protein SmpB [Clostridia bacterium]